MNNENIIELVYKKGLIQNECRKLCHNENLCGDLVQEVVVILLEKPAELINGLNARGELLRYIYAIARNQYNSVTSPFYKVYKKFNDKTKSIDNE